jgi:anaphase-promoting complex subunit 6
MDARNLTVLTGVAYTLHLKGNYLEALDMYHKANFIKSDDLFIIEMINRCMDDLLEQAN